MNGETRREQIIDLIKNSDKPISGTMLAQKMNVSRQIIVSDIALLRASHYDIISTNRGYLITEPAGVCCTIKVHHTDEEIEDELNTIVDFGGTVLDVYVNHKVYGLIKAVLNIRSRRNVHTFMKEIRSGKSTPLKNVTSGYHYHTIQAESTEVLELIKSELIKKGYLIK